MKKIALFLAVAVVMLLPSVSGAVLINFDSFSDKENLHGVNLGGVTLTSPNGKVEVFANNRFGASYRSPSNSIANIDDIYNVNPLVGVFDYPVSYVSLWAGDVGFDTDSWTLKLYDAKAGGNLLGSFDSGDWDGTPYVQLSGSFPNIWRFEAYWTGSVAGIAFDDLEFTPAGVPEPMSMLLLGFGLIGLAGLRKKIIN